jgi:hypothetical protein
VIYFFLQPTNMTLKFIILPIIKRKRPDLLYAMPMLIPLYFYAFSGNFYTSLKLYLFLYGLFGLALGKVLFCGHRLQELWTEGAEKI